MTTPPVSGVRLAWTVVPAGEARRDVAWRLLRGLLPQGAALTNPCARCGGPHGPVQVAGADALASVAYAGRLAVVGVADSQRYAAFGVDAEPDRDAQRDAAGLRGVLGPGLASLRDWTRVEAALKADGRGLRVDPAEVSVRMIRDAVDEGFGWEAVVPGRGVLLGWDAEGPEGVTVSVAVLPRGTGEAPLHPASS